MSNHLGCPSYPNCSDDPNGCIGASEEEVEMFGHKDPTPKPWEPPVYPTEEELCEERIDE